MGIWYPCMIFDLQLRFDEAFHIQENFSPPAQSPTTIANKPGSKGALADLFNSNPGVFGTTADTTAPSVRPLVSYGSQDALTQVGARIPKSASVELNGLRQAHTFNATFDFRDIPIDPRFIRYCRVEIFLGVVPPEKFARGMVTVEKDGSRASIINTENSSAPGVRTLLYGMVDECTVEHSDKGSTVHMSGRDLRGVLIDGKVDVRIYKDLNLKQPIDGVVRDILNKLPFTQNGVNVKIQPQEWPDQKVPDLASVNTLCRPRMSSDGKTPISSPQGPGDQIGFWDLITKYCMLVGAVPFFEGKDLLIRPTKSLYQQLNFDGTKPAEAFKDGKPRTLKLNGENKQTSIRTFVYGKNISSMKFTRKYGGQKAPVIVVFSIDTSSKKRGLDAMLIAQSPALKNASQKKQIDDARKTLISSSGKVAQTDVLRIPMPGIKSLPVLQAIADNLRHEIGRQELGGSAATKDFASFNTDKDDDPDMLTLKPGDAIQFFTDTRALSSNNPLVAELVEQQRRTLNEAIAVMSKTIDANLASVIAATARNSVKELQVAFRTKNVRYSLSEGGAVGIDFDFENFIEIRQDVDPALPQTTDKPKSKSTKLATIQ